LYRNIADLPDTKHFRIRTKWQHASNASFIAGDGGNSTLSGAATGNATFAFLI
jgi:hypothetical protein